VAREESDLYGLPLDEFVPARTELERRLRREGDRERAAAVKKLPKPTAAAWGVNQATRSQPKDTRELLAASKQLRDAQERLLAGDAKAGDLEKAAARQRKAIDSLTDAASGLLSSDGKPLGDATLARIRETLAAVAADPELAELVETGTLDRERQATGFGVGGVAEPDEGQGAKPRGSPKKQRGSAKAGEEREARERVKATRKEEREARRRLAAAERDAAKAAERLRKLEEEMEQARAWAEAAREELELAGSNLDDVVRAREAAETELERVRRLLDRA
jgi:hypothetical protein